MQGLEETLRNEAVQSTADLWKGQGDLRAMLQRQQDQHEGAEAAHSRLRDEMDLLRQQAADTSSFHTQALDLQQLAGERAATAERLSQEAVEQVLLLKEGARRHEAGGQHDLDALRDRVDHGEEQLRQIEEKVGEKANLMQDMSHLEERLRRDLTDDLLENMRRLEETLRNEAVQSTADLWSGQGDLRTMLQKQQDEHDIAPVLEKVEALDQQIGGLEGLEASLRGELDLLRQAQATAERLSQEAVEHAQSLKDEMAQLHTGAHAELEAQSLAWHEALAEHQTAVNIRYDEGVTNLQEESHKAVEVSLEVLETKIMKEIAQIASDVLEKQTSLDAQAAERLAALREDALQVPVEERVRDELARVSEDQSRLMRDLILGQRTGLDTHFDAVQSILSKERAQREMVIGKLKEKLEEQRVHFTEQLASEREQRENVDARLRSLLDSRSGLGPREHEAKAFGESLTSGEKARDLQTQPSVAVQLSPPQHSRTHQATSRKTIPACIPSPSMRPLSPVSARPRT